MAMDIETFLTKFHNLDGVTLNEKRKSLFLLLHNIPPDHPSLITSLKPKNHLESTYKLELLLKLQRIPDLIQILKSQDEYFPAKLLKNKWFCQQLAITLDEDPSDFVSAVLPFTSYVIRMRVINKLATYGTKLDVVYDQICDRYGVHIARNVLVGCSETKIRNVFQEEAGTILTPRDLKLLYLKHPQLFPVYMKQAKGIDESVLNFIASRDKELFLKLIQEFHLFANIGKRLTRRLLTSFKNVIIENADKFSHCIHLKTVFKVLSQNDSKQFFFKCFPSTIEDFCQGMGIYHFVNKIGYKKYYKLILEGTKKVYNKSLYDLPNSVNTDMMMWIDLEEREKLIDVKKRNGTSESDLYKYMRITKSIPLIKNKINVTSSINERDELVSLLVQTCKINNDLNALAEVLEYVYNRHRNENESILRNFLYSLQNHFELDKLGERHWKYIDSIFKILEMKGDNSFFKYDFLVEHFQYFYTNNELTDVLILKFLETMKKVHRFDYKIGDDGMRKLLLLKMIDFMPKLMEGDDKLESFDLMLICWTLQWNKSHLGDKISFVNYPRLTESFHKAVKEKINDPWSSEFSWLGKICSILICDKEHSTFRNEAIEIYYKMDTQYKDHLEIDLWLLKYEPDIINKHFDKFMTHILNSYHPDLCFLNYLKKYTHFSEKAISYCMKEISGGGDKLFIILAFLMPTENLVQSITQFYPCENKIDEDNEESKRRGAKAISVAGSLKYAPSGYHVLPIIVQYCKGDFLRHALESLYYQFYHTSENKLSIFINELSSKAVSVRKHAIFLTCLAGTVQDVQNLLKRYIKNERNVSVQKHLFTAAIKYFIKNPSDEFWESVKICMTNLDKNDSESFDLLLAVDRIPRKFKARHVIFVWEILKKLEEKRPKLLSSIEKDTFQDLPIHFLLGVIREYFLKNTSCKSAINYFVVSSLIDTSYGAEIMNIVLEMIGGFKATICDTLEEEKNVPKTISCFVKELIDALGTDGKNYQILKTFSEKWQALFTPVEEMGEHLKISFALLNTGTKTDLMKLSTVVAEFLNTLIPTFGIVIIDIFASELVDFLHSSLHWWGDFNEDFYEFCLHLLKNWNALTVYLLVIKLLPPKEPSRDKPKALYREIIHQLRQVPDESIQMLVNLHIINLC